MAAEEHNGGRSPADNPTKVDRSLDELARNLTTSNISRGRVLKIMGSALLGSVLAAVPGVAWADDRCPEGQTRCGDRCVNLQTNERHCGSCSNRCRSTQTCCKGRCVNLQRNERHCGSCFHRCAEGEECVSGECKPSCIPNGEPCTEATALQCCSGTCSGGKCAACPFGQELCNGSCVSNSCPEGQVFLPCRCACVNACPAGKVLLSNGTCAEPCDLNLCGGGPSTCFCVREAGTGGIYCVSNVSTTQCTDTCSCPTGQLCQVSHEPISTCAQVPQAFC